MSSCCVAACFCCFVDVGNRTDPKRREVVENQCVEPPHNLLKYCEQDLSTRFVA